MNIESVEQKIYDLENSGYLESILRNDNVNSILWGMFPNMICIQEYNSFIWELCTEQVYENYGDTIFFMQEEEINQEIEDLVEPMKDLYACVTVSDEIDLIFQKH